MRCSMGTSQAKLTVLPLRTVFLTGQPMANISDHLTMVNLAPFGRCRSLGFPATAAATAAAHGKLTPMPCSHNTPFPWMGGKDDYIVKGDPALLKSSTCSCLWGGTISIVDDGQKDTGAADLSRNVAISMEQILTGTEEKQGLDPETVLDGIQLALDAAGFVPGFGAIPDLTNAAIFALRGNWLEAGMSVLAAVPVIGDAATATKLAKKGYDAAKFSKMAKRSVGKNIDLSKETLMRKGMSREEAILFRRAVRNERRQFARQFYEEAGYKKTEIDSHLRGIAYDRPITIEEVPPPHTFYQYQGVREGKFRRGSYYTTDKNATPSQLGIHDKYVFRKNGREFPKQQRQINNIKTQRALKSTASGIDDKWSVPGRTYETEGGAVQYFMPIH